MPRSRSPLTAAAAIVYGVFVLASVGGCGSFGPCPEGTIEVRGQCRSPDGGTEAGTADAATDGSTAEGGTDGGSELVLCEPTGNYDAFGQPCQTQDDCSCPAGTCNTELDNTCTEVNCMRTGPDGGMLDVCPPDWTCTDVSGLPPAEVTSICLSP